MFVGKMIKNDIQEVYDHESIDCRKIQAFEESLYLNEKSKATVNKYLRAVRKLAEYLSGEGLTKSRLLEYRKILQSQVKAQTVNGALSSINAFLEFCGWQDCKIKLLKVQRKAFLDETRELSEAEYKQLLAQLKPKEMSGYTWSC